MLCQVFVCVFVKVCIYYEQLIIYFSIFNMNVYFSLICNPTLKVRVRNIFVNYECVDKILLCFVLLTDDEGNYMSLSSVGLEWLDNYKSCVSTPVVQKQNYYAVWIYSSISCGCLSLRPGWDLVVLRWRCKNPPLGFILHSCPMLSHELPSSLKG